MELFVITLIGLACLGISLKYCIYKCDIDNQIINNSNLILITEDENQDDEVPPKYEDI